MVSTHFDFASILLFSAGLTFLQQFGAGVQQRPSDHHHRGGSVTRFNVLGFGQFHQLKHTNISIQINFNIAKTTTAKIFEENEHEIQTSAPERSIHAVNSSVVFPH